MKPEGREETELESGDLSGPVSSGPRNGRPRGLLRLIGRALPPRLGVFVLPGLDVARAHGLDVEAAGLRPAATPRHATVLLVAGRLPGRFLDSAAVVYAQMPRPRTLIALEAGEVSPLPSPAVVAALTQEGLKEAVARTRQLLRTEAWSQSAQPFEAEVLLPKRRKGKKRRSSTKPEDAGEPAVASHGAMGHDPKAHDPKAHAGSGDGGMGGAGMEHGGMDHGAMSHGGGMEMGFMSMVRLTQHLPRSADGLAMERVQAPFGPYFPGLPSGLELTLWLDGDSVARVEVPRPEPAGAEQGLMGDPADLAERLGEFDLLAPASYRRLGELATLGLSEEQPGVTARRIIEAELERAASHLNWLAGFGHLLGYPWLSRRAAEWQLALGRSSDSSEVISLEPRLLGFLRRVRRTPLLAARLRGIGPLSVGELDGVSGPPARASGLERDARSGDPSYASLGFRPIIRHEGDALARLLLRLDEIGASLALARAAGQTPAEAKVPHVTARDAAVETPRGTARLSTAGDATRITEVDLTTPSQASLELIEKVAVGLELADALVAVASLDISPWEAYRSHLAAYR